MGIFRKNKADIDKKEYLLKCDCGSLEHTISLMWWPKKDEKEDYLYVEYHLSNGILRKRIWQAFKHIVGFRSKYGDCGEVLLTKKDIKQLILVLQEAEKEL